MLGYTPAVGNGLVANLEAEWLFNEATGQWAKSSAYKSSRPNRNLLNPSGLWFNASGNSAFGSGVFQNPYGDYSATWINWTNGGQQFIGGNIPTITARYVCSAWAKSASGTNEVFQMYLGPDGWSSAFTVTTNWQRFIGTVACTGGSQLFCFWGTQSAPSNVYLWGQQVEIGSSPSPIPEFTWDAQLGSVASLDSTDPTWTTNSLSFAGGSSQIAQAFGDGYLSLTNVTIYAVARALGTPVVAGNYPVLSDDRYPTNFLRLDMGYFMFSGIAVQPGSTPWQNLLDGSYHVLTGVSDGSHITMYRDGLLFQTNSGTMNPVAIPRLFFGKMNTAFLSGDIAYCSIFSKAHTTTEMAQEIAYIRGQEQFKGLSVPAPGRVLAWEGDSITSGQLATSFGYFVTTNYNTGNFFERSFAVSGSTTADLVSRASAVDQVLVSGATNLLCVMIGRNDISAATNTWVANFKSYCQARRAAGWKVLVEAQTPTNGATFNTERDNICALIAADPSFYDAFLRIDLDPTVGVAAKGFDTALYPDGTHPSATCYVTLTSLIKPAVAAFLGNN